MKKIALLIILFIIIVFSCIYLIFIKIDNKIYHENYKQKFTIKKSNSNKIDTLNFEILDSRTQIDQIACKFSLNFFDDSSKNSISIEEYSGVYENQGNLIKNIFFKPSIWIHPFRSAKMRYAELFPFPKVELPIYQGQKINWHLVPKGGWKELEGLEINGYLKVVSSKYVQLNGKNVKIWVIEAKSFTKLGNYKSTYYFSEKLGFVYFYYDFNQYQVEIKALNLN